MMRGILMIGVTALLIAGCASQSVEAQYLRYSSWDAFKASSEQDYTVTCGPYPAASADQRNAADARKAACIRDYEARGYVRITRPYTRLTPR